MSYLTGFILLYTQKPKYIWLGAFVLIIGTMQWVDATLWWYKHNNISTKTLSKYGVLSVLILEPIVGYLGYVYYSGNRIIPFEIILAVSSIYIAYDWISKCQETVITCDGYLKWCNNDFKSLLTKTIFLGLLFFPFLFFPDIFLRNMIMAVSFVLWLLSMNTDAFGSRWCHSFFILDILILLRLLY
jgi:hypothetical protein